MLDNVSAARQAGGLPTERAGAVARTGVAADLALDAAFFLGAFGMWKIGWTA